MHRRRGSSTENGWAPPKRLSAATCPQVVDWFWDCLSEMDVEQRAKLVAFVTGCSRLPVEGFCALRYSSTSFVCLITGEGVRGGGLLGGRLRADYPPLIRFSFLTQQRALECTMHYRANRSG